MLSVSSWKLCSRRSEIITLKIKRKLEFRGHVYFQAVWPQIVHATLYWLQRNNPLHKNNLMSIGENETHQKRHSHSPDNSFNDVKISDNKVLNADTSKDEDDPLNEHKITIETCLQCIVSDCPIILDKQNEINIFTLHRKLNVCFTW